MRTKIMCIFVFLCSVWTVCAQESEGYTVGMIPNPTETETG